jgi:hypothetical protein
MVVLLVCVKDKNNDKEPQQAGGVQIVKTQGPSTLLYKSRYI